MKEADEEEDGAAEPEEEEVEEPAAGEPAGFCDILVEMGRGGKETEQG